MDKLVTRLKKNHLSEANHACLEPAWSTWQTKMLTIVLPPCTVEQQHRNEYRV